MIKSIKIFFLAAFLFLTACESHDKNTLKVGTISGPETELMEVAKQVAKDKYRLKYKNH